MSDRDFIPYYYGLNYEAPPGSSDRGAFSSGPLGLLAGRAMRQSVVGGADAGLWLENLAGIPLEPARMMLNWGNETGGDELWNEAPKSDWTSYRTLPEAVSEFAGIQAGRVLDPVRRVGDVLRGENPYGQVDEVNTPSVLREAMVKDVFEAAGMAAAPGMFGSRASMSTVGAGVGKTAAGGLINKVADKFQSAYSTAREKSGGGSWVDIAVLRDNLGLSQEKMAGILRRATKEGHALMDLGEPSVVSEHLKGGMVDGKLLVKLEPSFFENIGSYIKQDVRKSLKQMEVDEIEKELLR